MGHKKGVELDGFDLVLLLTIIGLALIVAILVLPILPGAGAAVWKLCLVVLKFWHWPSWLWTLICATALVVLIWLRKQFA